MKQIVFMIMTVLIFSSSCSKSIENADILPIAISESTYPGNIRPYSIKSQIPQKLTQKNWEILDAVESKINSNGDKYIFVVYQQTNTKDVPQRKLLVIKESENGTYKIIAQNDHAVLKSDEGGVFGDPYDSMEIDNDRFVIKFYGGSSWRWYLNFIFKIENGEIYLIKQYSAGYNAGAVIGEPPEEMIKGDGSYINDYDYVNGVLKKTENKDGRILTSVSKIKPSHVSVSDFNIYDFMEI